MDSKKEPQTGQGTGKVVSVNEQDFKLGEGKVLDWPDSSGKPTPPPCTQVNLNWNMDMKKHIDSKFTFTAYTVEYIEDLGILFYNLKGVAIEPDPPPCT